MISRSSFFWPQAILLVAGVIPIALAEDVWWYLALVALAVPVGWYRTICRNQPLLGDLASRIFIISAFLFLLMEYTYSGTLLVLALSHFMILVCVSKLVSARSHRDDAQLFVLELLLIVVAAIVSGNIVFALVLIIFMTVGVYGLIRFCLAVEEARAVQAGGRAQAPADGRIPCGGAALLTGGLGLVLGSLVFVLCPRIEAGLLGHLEGPPTGPTVTGFTGTMSLSEGGPVQESQRPVMRVSVSASPSLTEEELSRATYFRGSVLHQYVQRRGRGSGWGWQRTDTDGNGADNFAVRDLSDETALLTLSSPDIRIGRTFTLWFYLEPHGSEYLFSVYPASSIGVTESFQVRESLGDQVLKFQTVPKKMLRYSVQCPVSVEWPSAEDMLADRTRLPTVILPDPALPAEQQIIDLVNREIPGADATDDPRNWERFAGAVERFLRSGRFMYTLDPPALRPGAEPVGEFLLRNRRGYCQHFASAMAVMCQLKGVSARIVNGYRGGEWNPFAGQYVVRQKDAHAWVEVYVPGKDWVLFDPTPGGRETAVAGRWWLVGAHIYLDYIQFQWANLVMSYDADARRDLFGRFHAWMLRPIRDERTVAGAVVAFVRELFGGRLELEPTDRLLYWVFALLVVALVVLISYVVITVGRRLAVRVARWHQGRLASAAARGEGEFYDRFCRRLAVFGLRRAKAQTPAEFAADLAARFPALRDAPELVRIYYEVAYGQQPLSPPRRQWIERFLKRLRQLDPKQRYEKDSTPVLAR